MTPPLDTTTIAVVGLGCVGLPLAIEFGKRYRTIGFDLAEAKIGAYRGGRDPTGEVADAEFAAASRLVFTTDAARLAEASFVVVAVPTPVNEAKRPDFGPLKGRAPPSGATSRGADVAVLGLIFKEDCADPRNSPVIDVIRELASFGVNAHVHDPVAEPAHAKEGYGMGSCRGMRCRARGRWSPRSRTGRFAHLCGWRAGCCAGRVAVR